MKIWITTSAGNDEQPAEKRAYGSKDDARAGFGVDANGEAALVDVNSDKEGILALFNGTYTINSTEKLFKVKNGKWHTVPLE